MARSVHTNRIPEIGVRSDSFDGVSESIDHRRTVDLGTVWAVERSFFHQVLDVFEGFVGELDGELHSAAHGRGLKVWYDDAEREHYEAQLIRLDGKVGLEIGFHSEYPKPKANDEVLGRLVANEKKWRKELGDEPEAGPFLGADKWRRISEVWEVPDPDEIDAAIEIAARLADYALVLEPLRRKD